MKNNIIYIDLDNRDEYINKYDDSRICDELHNYIIEEALKLNSKSKILIQVKFNYIVTEQEKNKLRMMILNDFKNNIKGDINKNRDIIKDIFFVLIGLSCIVISIMFGYLNKSIISELFLIIGWVPIWEFVGNILFIETFEVEKKRKYKQLLNSTIKFK